MKRVTAIGLGLGCGLAAAATCVGATAQAPAKPVHTTATQTTGKPAAKTAPKPTAAPMSGPGSLQGVWMNAAFKDYRTGPPVGAKPGMKTETGEPVPMLPAVAERVAQRLKGFDNGHPYAGNSSKCLTDGMPSAAGTPAELALQFVETPGQITVLYEFFTTFRVIHLNAKHPDDPDPAFMGNAVAHWENGTLVVDTIAVSDKTNVMNIIPHSEDLHIVEHIRRTGPETMEDRVTIDDPKTFSKTWSYVNHFKRVPGASLHEFVCENNRNPPSENGTTGVKLQSGG